jgi:hypothetical protein
MTVEQPEDRPLSLRDLASAESPDVVSAALRRFRRRTVIRGAWVAGLVLASLLVLPLLPGERPSLPERYYASPIVSVAQEASRGPFTVTVLDGARFDRETGALHLLARTRTALPIGIAAVYRGVSTAPENEMKGGDIYQSTSGRLSEAFVALPVVTSHITVVVTEAVGDPAHEARTTITIDLRGSRELQDLWR